MTGSPDNDDKPADTPNTVKKAIECLKELWGGNLETMAVRDWISSFEKIPVETAGRAVALERLNIIRMTPDAEERRKKTEEFVQDCFDVLDANASPDNSKGLKRFLEPRLLNKVAANMKDIEYSPTILKDRSDALNDADSTEGWARGGKLLTSALSILLAAGGAAKAVKSATRPFSARPSVVMVDGRPISQEASLNEGQTALFLFLFSALSATGIPLSKVFEDQGKADKAALNVVSAIDGLVERELGKIQAQKNAPARS
jgi:hypothetical protein